MYKLATENKRYFKIITNNAIKIIVRLKNYFNDDEDIQELDEILCRKIDNKFDKPNKIELLFCEIIKMQYLICLLIVWTTIINRII